MKLFLKLAIVSVGFLLPLSSQAGVETIDQLRKEFEVLTRHVTKKMLVTYRQEFKRNQAGRVRQRASAGKVRADRDVEKKQKQIADGRKELAHYQYEIPALETEVDNNNQRIEELRKQKENSDIDKEIARLEKRNEELLKQIDSHRARMMELEGDEKTQGLLDKWEKEELPQLVDIQNTKNQRFIVADKKFNTQQQVFEDDLVELVSLQEDQETKRLEIYAKAGN